jgi:hypothetical protein
MHTYSAQQRHAAATKPPPSRLGNSSSSSTSALKKPLHQETNLLRSKTVRTPVRSGLQPISTTNSGLKPSSSSAFRPIVTDKEVENLSRKIDKSINIAENIEILDSNKNLSMNFLDKEEPSRLISLNNEPKVKNILINRTSSPIRLQNNNNSINMQVNKTPSSEKKKVAFLSTVREKLNPRSPARQSPLAKQPVIARIVIENDEYFENIDLDKRDVKYYRSLVDFNTKKLTNFIDTWSKNKIVPDDYEGDVRLACGLARLLIDERFNQFSGLINQCEQQQQKSKDPNMTEDMNQDEEVALTVKCTDLQGFWDMVDNQVKDVVKKFNHLEKLKQNNYQLIEEEQNPLFVGQKSTKTGFKVNKNYLKKKDQQAEDTNSENVAVQQQEKKPKPSSKFAEFKAQMLAKKQQQMQVKVEDISVEIVTTPSKPIVEKKAESTTRKSASTRRRSKMPIEDSTNKNIACTGETPKRYNLRSRPSDLIKFTDSPLIHNPMEPMKEEDEFGSFDQAEKKDVFKPFNNAQQNPSRKSCYRGVLPTINVIEEDKENEDFFNFDTNNLVTWKPNEQYCNRLSFLPSYGASPTQTKTTRESIMPSGLTPSKNNEPRPSIMINSPLLKLALISSKSKRLSMGGNQ